MIFLRLLLLFFGIKLIKCQNIGNFQQPLNQNPYYQQDLNLQNQQYQQQLQQQFLNKQNYQYNLFQKPVYNVTIVFFQSFYLKT
jgi:hypothetical protein